MAVDRPRFEEVTEAAGTRVTGEGADMLYSRYQYAAELGQDQHVLEIGCGVGQGFGLVGSRAARLVGGDYTLSLLQRERQHYGERYPAVQLTAESLPFADSTFDLVLFFEASYYVSDMELAFDEVRRVLAGDGVAVFVNANPERSDFIKSLHSTHYHTADEFRVALGRRGFAVSVEGAFPVATTGISGFVIYHLRRIFERAGVIPKTLSGRAVLKQLMHRRLVRLPPELPQAFGTTAPAPRVGLSSGPARGFKVIYVTARKLAAPPAVRLYGQGCDEIGAGRQS